ncbi:MAG: hypothetical protein SFW36_22580 [Leptolyngbyaceae cyanobacterium bins.59]|nr:hypothetical protein [Leptolyngbyaceae cyanobacterium bins.59]
MAIPTPDPVQQTLLAEALQFARSLANPSPHPEPSVMGRRRDRLRQIQQQLQGFAHPLCHDRIPATAIPMVVRHAFVNAVLLLRYRSAGSTTWKGTLTSPTLNQYRPDPLPTHLISDNVLSSLGHCFELPEDAIQESRASLQQIERTLTRQKRILQAVLAELGSVNLSRASESPGSEAVLTLFQNLFSAIPIPLQALDCIFTETQIYFCINYQEGKLADRLQWDSLSDSEQTQVQGFLDSLGQFSFDQFGRFPTFGPCIPDRIHPIWCEQIARQCGEPTAQVLQTLTQSIGVIPTHKAEAFLVHDVWGHYWQLLLTQFGGDYAILTHCDEPLRAAETAYTAEGPLTCGDLFSWDGKTVQLDEAKTRSFFQGEVQQRLGVIFTHLIGEMIADVAEFKFVWDHSEAADQLLSSSLFKDHPTKLDLSLTDVDFLFLRVLRPLLEMHLSVFTDSVLEADILALWRERNYPTESLTLRTCLKQAIVRLYQIFLEEYNRTYLPTLTGQPGIFAQIVSNLVYLQNVISELYQNPIAQSSPNLPFQDLLMLFIGCYCSSDSYREFWAIDDVLANYFLPCWRLLQDSSNHWIT